MAKPRGKMAASAPTLLAAAIVIGSTAGALAGGRSDDEGGILRNPAEIARGIDHVYGIIRDFFWACVAGVVAVAGLIIRNRVGKIRRVIEDIREREALNTLSVYGHARRVREAAHIYATDDDGLGGAAHSCGPALPAPRGSPEQHPVSDGTFRARKKFSMVQVVVWTLAVGLIVAAVMLIIVNLMVSGVNLK